MRYEVRRANLGWHVFDTHEYTAVLAFPANRMEQALIECGVLNQE